MAIFFIGLAAGMFASLVGLGNALFGSYARSAWGSLWRILLVTFVSSIGLLAGAAYWVFPDLGWTQLTLAFFSMLGVLEFAYFLFPYQWGIKRVHDIQIAHTEELAPGIVLNEYNVRVAAPESTSPESQSPEDLSLLIVSDIHCNNSGKLTDLDQAVSVLATHPQPDFVLHLGDFGENEALLPDVVGVLSKLDAKYSTLCVLGNHDCEGGRREVLLPLLASNGIQYLEDELHVCADANVSVIGLIHPWSGRPIPMIEPGGFRICMTHTPDNIAHFHAMGVDIGFAGHTHGGKWRLPFIGAVLVPGKLGRFLDRGWFKLRNALLFVTAGIGYFPRTSNTPGEINRVTPRR